MHGKLPERPKGNNNTNKIRKSRYILSEARKRQNVDYKNGIIKGIEN